jgi:RNA polymerase sigma factor (TIGR02999 family)
MRRILVDHARRRDSGKRGGGMGDLSLDEALIPAQSDNSDVVALDEALSKLEEFDGRKCRVVEMRYFGGCTVEETAEALGIAEITVIRETRVAEAWLRRTMLGQPAPGAIA